MSPYQAQAAFMFPKTARTGNIRGDGQFAVLVKCGRRWQLWMWLTAEARAAQLKAWNETGCCSQCMHNHQLVEVKPDFAWIDSKAREHIGRRTR
jgi:hypothetical protein